MQKVALFSLMMLLGAHADINAQDQAWIVLDSLFNNSKPAQMAFNNPAFPDITESECTKSLSTVEHSLVKVAMQREPRLATAKFLGTRCVMSVGDPIKPN